MVSNGIIFNLKLSWNW